MKFRLILKIVLLLLIFDCLLLYPNNKNFEKGVELYFQKKFLQAISYFKKALSEGFEDQKCYFYLANSYVNNEEYDKAINLYIKAQEISKSLIYNSYLYYNLGYAYYLKKDYDNAIKYFDESFKLNSKLASIFWIKGMAYYNKKDKDNTIISWKKYLELEPNGPESDKIRKALEILTSSNFVFFEKSDILENIVINNGNISNLNNENLIDIEGILGENILKDKDKVEEESYESIER